MRLVLDLCVIELVMEVESILDYDFDLMNYVVDFLLVEYFMFLVFLILYFIVLILFVVDVFSVCLIFIYKLFYWNMCVGGSLLSMFSNVLL